MGFLDAFFHPEKGYERAQDELNRYYGQAQDYLNPYIKGGQQAFNPLYGAMSSLLDPTKLQAEWTKSYTMSPQAQQAQSMANQSGLNAASAMGLLGSRTGLDALQAGTSQIALNDRQNYLNDLMQKYLAGTGIGQNIYNTGAGAAGQAGQNAMNMGQNSAQMAYGQQNSQGNLFGGALGLLGSLGSSALSGPIGGALASRWNLSGGQ